MDGTGELIERGEKNEKESIEEMENANITNVPGQGKERESVIGVPGTQELFVDVQLFFTVTGRPIEGAEKSAEEKVEAPGTASTADIAGQGKE